MTTERLKRVVRFLESAQVLADPAHALFEEARARLPAETGLSAQNVEWALRNALEVHPSSWDLTSLLVRVPACNRAHVLLSANVFVGALRAIVLGIAAATEVHVRASRREPAMVQLLSQAAPGQFRIVQTLAPSVGDHVWAYGSDETMQSLRSALPEGTLLHAHGSGFGVVVLFDGDLRTPDEAQRIARAIAVDTAAFDQRGCLSPRVVLVEAERSVAREFASLLADALSERERVVPRGTLSSNEREPITRYHDTLCVSGLCIEAGSGFVSFELDRLPFILPPAGRVLHVRTVESAMVDLRAVSAQLTTIGFSRLPCERARHLAAAFPGARVAECGLMQCPMLDGPVDLRHTHG